MMEQPPFSVRVLIADYSPDARRALGLLLGLRGHEVRTAADGTEAVRLAETFRPDVVLLDLTLPGVGGFEAARRLRRRGTGTLLVALTAPDGQTPLADALAAGFDDHLPKPCDPSRLYAVLRKAAAGRPPSRPGSAELFPGRTPHGSAERA